MIFTFVCFWSTAFFFLALCKSDHDTSGAFGEFDTDFYVAIIFIYMKHITTLWYLCESIASNLARHSAGFTFNTKTRDAKISEKASRQGGEVTGGL